MAQDVLVRFRADVNKFKKDLRTVKQDLGGVKTGAAAAQKQVGAFGNIAAGLGKQLLALGGAFAVFNIIKSIGKTVVEFEKNIASLAAITGATGQDLEFLKQKSIELGAASGIGAAETAKAFELIASAKPALLENGKALAEVTKQAIILSQASGLDLTAASNAVTTALNQFGLEADQTERAVNALAAGAKFGASAIPATADAIKRFGAVASQANIPLEESVALVEVLAEKQITAGDAGTGLRNVILRLQKAGKGFVDGQFNIQAALEQVKNEFDNITDPIQRAQAATKLFGVFNITAGEILLDNVDRLEYFKNAVTGTNVAVEQAAITQATLSAKSKQLGTTWDALVLSIDNGDGAVSNLIRTILELTTEILALTAGIEKSEDKLDDHEEAIRSTAEAVIVITKVIAILTTGLISYNVATRLSTALTAAYASIQKILATSTVRASLATKAATLSMRAFNIAIKSNPIGLLISLLATGAAALFAFSDDLDDAAESQKNLNDEIERGATILDGLNPEEIAGRIMAGMSVYGLSIKELEAATQAFREELDNLSKDSLPLLAKEGETAEEFSKRQEQAYNRQREELLKLIDTIGKAIEIKRKEEEANKNGIRTYEALKKEISELNKELLDQAVQGEISQKTIESYKDKTKEAEEAVNRLKWAMEGLFDVDMNKPIEGMESLTDSTVKLSKAQEEAKKQREKEQATLKPYSQEQQAVYDELLQKMDENAAREKEIGDLKDERNRAIAQSTFDVSKAFLDRETELRTRALDKQLDGLEELRDKKIITDEQFAKRSEQLEREKSELLRKAAERDKAIAIFESLVNTAVGVTAALKVPPPAGPILASTNAILGAAQTATIIAQPIPEFAKGGWIDGKSHKQGGEIIEAEGGEFVVSKRYAKSHKNLLESVNSGTLDKYINQRYLLPALMGKKDIIVKGKDFTDKNLLYSDKQTRKELKAIREAIMHNNNHRPRLHY